MPETLKVATGTSRIMTVPGPSRGLISPSRRCRVHATTHEARCPGPAHSDGHLPLGFRARGSEVVANLAGRPEPRGIRETISSRERRLGALLDDGDLLGDRGLPHATRASPRGDRLRHVHGCPALGEDRADYARPAQAGEGPGRRGELRMDRETGENLGEKARGRDSERSRFCSPRAWIDPPHGRYCFAAATTTLLAPNDFVIRFVLSEEDFAK